MASGLICDNQMLIYFGLKKLKRRKKGEMDVDVYFGIPSVCTIRITKI